MGQFIYTSGFSGGPEATKKQQILFAADAEYAYGEGYEYIQDTEGTIFFMVNPTELYECEPHITEDYLQSLDESEVDPDEDYCIHCHNLKLIDEVINNTLSKDTDITPDQADTMLKLARLKQMLGA